MSQPSTTCTPLQRLFQEAFERRRNALNYQAEMQINYYPGEELECLYRWPTGRKAFEQVLWVEPTGIAELEIRKLTTKGYLKLLFKCALDLSRLTSNTTSLNVLKERSTKVVDLFEKSIQTVLAQYGAPELENDLMRLWDSYLDHFVKDSPSPRPTTPPSAA
jgi:hypothetical protein